MLSNNRERLIAVLEMRTSLDPKTLNKMREDELEKELGKLLSRKDNKRP